MAHYSEFLGGNVPNTVQLVIDRPDRDNLV